jgi:hypothetical protein
LVPLASKTVAVRDVDGFTSPVNSSTFQSAGCLKDSRPSGNVYVARAAGAGADADPDADGLAAVVDGTAVVDADGAPAAQPARLMAAAVARAAMKVP